MEQGVQVERYSAKEIASEGGKRSWHLIHLSCFRFGLSFEVDGFKDGFAVWGLGMGTIGDTCILHAAGV